MTKHVYPRGEVWASPGFDFYAFLAAGRPGGKGKGSRSGGLPSRIHELRRFVGLEGGSLAEARKRDFEAYAADLPRLRQLAEDHAAQPENAPQLGDSRRKGSALFLGRSRAGKDTLVECTAAELVRLAGLAGLAWSVVRPAGEHASENIGTAEVVHHEDLRFQFSRSYDDALRYLDPNRATFTAARNKNLPPVAPRAILMTSSETLGSLALSMKARKSSEDLATTADKFGAVNVDEFLFRLGFVVEVTKPTSIALDDRDGTKREMLVAISRVEMVPDSRIEEVQNRDGDARLGHIRTSHTLEPIAIVKGCDPAARFLAHEIMAHFSPDVAAKIPEAMQAFAPERQAIEEAHRAILDQRARDHEAAMVAAAEAEYGPDYAAHFAANHLDGDRSPNPLGVPILSDAWRGQFRFPCCIATRAISKTLTAAPAVYRG
ncbi:hypothetical protein FVO59_03035 [Microbacterium esteraromaticum]|uniref:Uncharacterized protein n=1 Tax=Microbacterium esteraromaticum TaxID=57043 RepID=A0A7D7W7B1_9MICO|nr:hypothetical protein [Microbacterium esteraromaticum]QMU96295.1 hypothetical protein FVO59_03035 [Microbacterium esteraromaticum]